MQLLTSCPRVQSQMTHAQPNAVPRLHVRVVWPASTAFIATAPESCQSGCRFYPAWQWSFDVFGFTWLGCFRVLQAACLVVHIDYLEVPPGTRVCTWCWS